MYTNIRPVPHALLRAVAGGSCRHSRAGASAHKNPKLRFTETFTLNIYDAYLSNACGVEVVATLTATEERTVFPGADEDSPASERTTYDGDITWLAPASGATYSDELKSR